MKRLRWHRYAVALAGLALAACTQWSGPSSVRLKDGRVEPCSWLVMDMRGITCGKPYHGALSITWAQIAGYAAGSEVR